jgi:LPS-assembly protein
MHYPLLAVASSLLASGTVAWGQAQQAPPAPPAMTPSVVLRALPKDGSAGNLPVFLQARTLRSQIDLQAQAEGQVEFRSGGLVIRADTLDYQNPLDLAQARGHVRISREGVVYSGRELQLSVQRFEGFFLQPEFEFLQLGAGGRADRVDFLGDARSRATNASYTSCPRDGAGEPDWVLKARSVELDLDADEGVAEGAQLRFLGVPILALPSLSFPLNEARRSGWLPPSVDVDNRSGVMVSVPYYWNIAPNRDATIAPRVITRRGLGVEAEFRYLETRDAGEAKLDWLPNDRVAGRARSALQWRHEGSLEAGRLRYWADVAHVSDDDWWKDFPDDGRSFTPRMLPLRVGVERALKVGPSTGVLYAKATAWQVLQDTDSFIEAPYARAPQLGLRLGGTAAGWQFGMESEFNRFVLSQTQQDSTARVGGERWHLVGALSRPLREPGWWVVPRLAVNAAAYRGTQASSAQASNSVASHASRVIPTFSLDTGMEFERSTYAFGRTLHQTLEPRFLYVNTPYRLQSDLPAYDAAAKDFNFSSIYSENTFSGIDRVSDSHQLTAGFTTRLVDASSGAEALRLGLVQRYLFRPQRVTAKPDGSADGEPLTQRFSDVLLLGSTSVLPGWTLDASVQYSPDIQRSVRSIVGGRYSPGPFRTVGATYRLARGLSEQLEVGWQWPLSGADAGSGRRKEGSNCSGAWYSVGRFNYSIKDQRLTDSVLGVEYDTGCWIGRVVVTQLSTGQSEATTRIMFQLELVGLSRIGSNPLKVLKDNIPGYRLLREERGGAAPPSETRPMLPPFYD